MPDPELLVKLSVTEISRKREELSALMIQFGTLRRTESEQQQRSLVTR